MNPLFLIYIYYMVELTRDRHPPLKRRTVNDAKDDVAEITGHPAETIRDWYKISKRTIATDPMAEEHLNVLRRMRDEMGTKATVLDLVVEFDMLVKRGNLLRAAKGELSTFPPTI